MVFQTFGGLVRDLKLETNTKLRKISLGLGFYAYRSIVPVYIQANNKNSV